MVISTHSVVGGVTAGVLTGVPFLGFLVGILTHYILDYFPHWDYRLRTTHGEAMNAKNLYFDLTRLILDAFLALVFLSIVFWFGSLSLIVVLSGALGGILPDIFQLIYKKIIKTEPFESFQKIHDFFHTSNKIQPLKGILVQVFLILFFVFLGLSFPSPVV